MFVNTKAFYNLKKNLLKKSKKILQSKIIFLQLPNKFQT